MLNFDYRIDSYAITDIGLVRDHNEDALAIYPKKRLFLLADGMGGHAGGEVASEQSIRCLSQIVEKWHFTKHTSPDEAVGFFSEALTKVNHSIYQQAQAEPSLQGMGTTICVLFFLDDYAVVAHVGDSRIYRIRERQIKQLTEDHSLVSELVSLGAMKEEEGKTFPYKHILTRAIGTSLTVEPTVSYLSIQPQDCFILCSDGLTNYVTDEEIEMILNTECSLEEQAQSLVDLGNKHGGGDNISTILVKIYDDLSG